MENFSIRLQLHFRCCCIVFNLSAALCGSGPDQEPSLCSGFTANGRRCRKKEWGQDIRKRFRSLSSWPRLALRQPQLAPASDCFTLYLIFNLPGDLEYLGSASSVLLDLHIFPCMENPPDCTDHFRIFFRDRYCLGWRYFLLLNLLIHLCVSLSI